MSDTPSNNLGTVITNAFVRKLIYGVYVLALTATGATQVWFATTTGSQPEWLIGAMGVLAYLGVPIGGLALVNTNGHHSEPNPPGT